MEEPKRYKAIFVDLDDTLYDSASLYEQAISMSWEHFHKFYDITFEDYKDTFLAIRKALKEKYKFKTTSHHRAILFERLLEHYRIPFNADLILELYETYWFSVNTYIQPFPNVLSTLQTIHSAGIKILALSDGTILSRLTKLRSLKISPLIDLLVSSEEVMDTKPKPRVFDLALEKSNLTKNDVIFIGNSFKADIVGGEMYGIDTVWFNPHGDSKPRGTNVEPDHIIKDFSELLPIIQIKY